MVSENKIQEYMDSLEQEKIMIETHFANIERILNDNPKLDQEKAFGLLSNFNTLNIQYDQLCNDLTRIYLLRSLATTCLEVLRSLISSMVLSIS